MRAFIALLGIAFLCAGCIYVQHTPPPAPSPRPTPPGPASDAATLAEIDAAANLSFEHSRLSALQAIASRPQLSPPAQVRLVNAAYSKLMFEHSQVALLQSIIGHAAFCNAAKEAILAQLNKLDFDHNRRALLDAISHRGNLNH